MSIDTMSFVTKRSPWWLILMGGVLNVVVGFLLLTAPVKTVFLLVATLGMYWIVGGIFTLVGMFVDHTAWGWKLFTGLLSIIAGTAILRYPLISTLTVPAVLVLMLGIQGFIVGFLDLIMAFKGGGWGVGILGVVSMVFGVILIANYTSPGMILTLVWVAAIFALASGITQIVHAFQARSA
jgi:uncharacterized membrane protein HdeD (DUF308 family)